MAILAGYIVVARMDLVAELYRLNRRIVGEIRYIDGIAYEKTYAADDCHADKLFYKL